SLPRGAPKVDSKGGGNCMGTAPWQSQWIVVRELLPGGACCTFLVRRAGASSDESFVLKTLRDPTSPVRRAMMCHEAAARGTPDLLDFGLTSSPEPVLTIDPESGRHIGDRFIYLPEDSTRGADRKTDLSDLTQCAGLLFYLVTHQPPETLIDDRGRRPHERD